MTGMTNSTDSTFTPEDLEIISEVLEMALADPGFIDTTSGGAMSPADAAGYRSAMSRVQAKAARIAAGRQADGSA